MIIRYFGASFFVHMFPCRANQTDFDGLLCWEILHQSCQVNSGVYTVHMAFYVLNYHVEIR